MLGGFRGSYLDNSCKSMEKDMQPTKAGEKCKQFQL